MVYHRLGFNWTSSYIDTVYWVLLSSKQCLYFVFNISVHLRGDSTSFVWVWLCLNIQCESTNFLKIPRDTILFSYFTACELE